MLIWWVLLGVLYFVVVRIVGREELVSVVMVEFSFCMFFLLVMLYRIRVLFICGIMWLVICFGYCIGCWGFSLKFLRLSLIRVIEYCVLLSICLNVIMFCVGGCVECIVCWIKVDFFMFLMLIMVMLMVFMVGLLWLNWEV